MKKHPVFFVMLESNLVGELFPAEGKSWLFINQMGIVEVPENKVYVRCGPSKLAKEVPWNFHKRNTIPFVNKFGERCNLELVVAPENYCRYCRGTEGVTDSLCANCFNILL